MTMSAVIKSVVSKAASIAKTTLAVVGVASLGKLYYEYQALQPLTSNKQKRVLEIDFDKLDLVERKEYNYSSSERLTMEVRELIDILHRVASDDSVVGIYGKFNWNSLNSVGWADLEELRNAIQVIEQSHRRHPDPNLSYDKIVIPKISKKFLYAYADSFSSMADPSNKSYYLASAFTDVHLQENAELSLFGNLSSVYFIRDLLEQYRVNVHVFKHGIYKTAPNMFTHYRLNKAHREQLQTLHDAIQDDINNEIVGSRSKALLTSWLKPNNWKSIYNSGTFPAHTAWKAGLVDYLPRRDPLNDLVAAKDNKDDESNNSNSNKWNVQETNFKKFTAESKVTLKDYAKDVKRATAAARKMNNIKSMIGKYSFLEPVASTLGLDVTTQPEKIAVLYVNGTIADSMADTVMESLEKIKKDPPKAVVLRVNSRGGSILACEKIQQELMALEIPMVVSFGNYSASGGYYIATPGERIFGSRKTITGSIGVFGIRMDLTKFADKYGVNVQQIASGDLSATYNPMAPMSRKMKEAFSKQIDRYYDQFKSVVAKGRSLDLETVETLAQGQVYTGTTAKQNGLVDELGGLHRAIAYAKRNYAKDADIDIYPKEKTFWEKLSNMKNAAQVVSLLRSLTVGTELAPVGFNDKLVKQLLNGGIPCSGIYYSSDENAAIQCLLSNKTSSIELPDWFWDD